MPRQFFGTDGIRGTVGQPPITPDFVLRLAHAVGRVLRRTEAHPTVLIGKDTRISGYMLEAALESGFNSAGVDVVLLGPVPTPAVAYLTRAQRASLGVVISASHNPFADNGIKFFSAQGTKLPDDWEHAVEASLDEAPVWAASADLGKSRRLDDAAGRYIEFCKSTCSNNLSLKGMKIVVDGANGAAYQIAPAVFHELGAEVIKIGCSPDGLNINHGVGATHPQAMVEAVKAHGAHYGIALDGDADRLQMVDADGRLYNGDELLYLIVADRLARDHDVPGVVGTLMTNMAVEVALKARGVKFVRAKVGDRYVLEALRERGWLYGGENSGHVLCLDRHTTGDAIISALQVLTAMRETGETLASITSDLRMYPQVLVNVRVPAGFDMKAHAAIESARASAQAGLEGRGRILLRPSGTEPLLRVMVEGEPRDAIEGAANRIAEAVRRAAGV